LLGRAYSFPATKTPACYAKKIRIQPPGFSQIRFITKIVKIISHLNNVHFGPDIWFFLTLALSNGATYSPFQKVGSPLAHSDLASAPCSDN
jgi:hypothetical protein